MVWRWHNKEVIGSCSVPCRLAHRNIFIRTDIVDSDISLLLSKNSTKEAKVKPDLENDKAEIFGKLLYLDCLSSVYCCVPLHSTPVNVEECMLAEKIEDIRDKQNILNKIHKRFAHPNDRKLKDLMIDAGICDEEYKGLIVKLDSNCEICKRFQKTPATPAVCLPLASDFNDVVAMDLKSWKKGHHILYLIHLADSPRQSLLRTNCHLPSLIKSCLCGLPPA